MGENHTIARLTKTGERFEILVRPDRAFDYKRGKRGDIDHILVADTIFTDASKGLRASEDKLHAAFQTTDPFVIAEIILQQGELQLTIEQRRELVREKRKQIVAFLTRNCIDPRTRSPHPPLRIEQALDQIKITIDPFRDGEEQAREVIDKLRPILPLRIEQIRIAVKVPPEYGAQTLGMARSFATVSQDEWQRDGSWIGIVEMPAGLHTTFLDRLGRITHGNYQTKILK
jgi:ribosome maturation protein SDO1